MTRVTYVSITSQIGGAENNLLRIIRTAPVQGVRPAALLLPGEGPLGDRAREIGVPVGLVSYHALRWTNPLPHARTLWTLRSWICRTHSEVIHLNHQWLVEFAVRAGQITGRPVVCHIRNLLSSAEIAPLLPWLMRADAVVGVSKAVMAPLRAAGVPEAKLHLIHNGLDIADLARVRETGGLHRELGLSEEVLLVGVIGRVVPEKGIEELLHAVAILHSKLGDCHYVIVGADDEQGAYIDRLRQTAVKLGMEEHVTFTGFRQDVPAILHELDLVVLPSRSDMPEGLPNTVLEALAAGRIVVATRNSGVPEVVHDGVNGFLAECDDIPGLAGAIERAMALPKASRLQVQEQAKRSVQDRTMENQLRQLGDLYRQLIAARHLSHD